MEDARHEAPGAVSIRSRGAGEYTERAELAPCSPATGSAVRRSLIRLRRTGRSSLGVVDLALIVAFGFGRHAVDTDQTIAISEADKLHALGVRLSREMPATVWRLRLPDSVISMISSPSPT